MQKLQVVRRSEDRSEDRVGAIIQQLAKKLAEDLGRPDDTELLLKDDVIAGKLREAAENKVREEDLAKEKAEQAEREEFLRAAKRKLGIFSEPVKDVKLAVAIASGSKPGAWQEYLEAKGEGFLPTVFSNLDSEEIAAARGCLIGALKRFRQHSDWVDSQMSEAVKVWDSMADALLSKISPFFKDRDGLKSSREVFTRVSSLLEAEPKLKWFFDGPKAIKRQLDKAAAAAKRNERKAAQTQQDEATRLAKKMAIIELLTDFGTLPEEADRIAGAVIKRFPGEDSPEKALFEMAVLRQMEAALKDRKFLSDLAHEAEVYFLSSGMKLDDLLAKVRQQPSITTLLKRGNQGFGEMSESRGPSKKNKKSKGK